MFATSASATHGGLHFSKGRVKHIADGDTYDVQMFGDGTTALRRIRMTGIQTMESGDCHSKRAEVSLRKLINRKVVRMGVVDPESYADDPNRAVSRKRLLRYTDTKRNGAFRKDIGRIQLQRGNAIWLPHLTEDARHAKYHAAMLGAAKRGRGLFDTNFCGNGPWQTEMDSSLFKMWVQSDAPGNDKFNLDGEFVRFHNKSASTINLSGWTLRGAGQLGWTLPSTAIVPANGGVLTVHVGSGTNRPGHVYMGDRTPHFMNIYEYTEGYIGDGAYLFDKQGDLRKWFTYPCRPTIQNCDPDGYSGKVQVSHIQWDAPGGQPEPPSGEWVIIKNVSAVPVNLFGYVLESQPYLYDFKPGTVIQPGRTLKVVVGRGTDTADTVYWGLNIAIMQEDGDSVTLRSYDYMTLSCRDYNSPPADRRCPTSKYAVSNFSN